MCVFCDIVNHKQEAEIIFEDDEVIVFKNIKPIAPIHLLVVPKRHIDSINDLKDGDRDIIGKMVLTAKQLADENNINQEGYQLFFNDKNFAGVYHVHLHLISKRKVIKDE